MTAPAPSDVVQLADKVEFLGRPQSYGGCSGVRRIETHMSWLFILNDLVYKLKKPVRFPYLDFSTLAKREAACRAEAALNRALAPGVYLGVTPLTEGPRGIDIGGEGRTIEWLVIMRRLDVTRGLDRRLVEDPPSPGELNGLTAELAHFYRHARRVRLDPMRHLAAWRSALLADRAVLLDPALKLPAAMVRRIDRVLQRMLRIQAATLLARTRAGRIVDGHGDLRPEHIFLDGLYVRIIDRLEFNTALRAVDPLDEVVFLDLECERLGAADVGRIIRQRVQRQLGERPQDSLIHFYRCHRAMLRARLSIAHLLEPNPRTPEKWPRQALAYLRIAARDALRLEVLLNRRRDPRGLGLAGAGRSSLRKAERRVGFRLSCAQRVPGAGRAGRRP